MGVGVCLLCACVCADGHEAKRLYLVLEILAQCGYVLPTHIKTFSKLTVFSQRVYHILGWRLEQRWRAKRLS